MYRFNKYIKDIYRRGFNSFSSFRFPFSLFPYVCMYLTISCGSTSTSTPFRCCCEKMVIVLEYPFHKGEKYKENICR